MTEQSGRDFLEGLRDGLPIGLGYLAVAFSLGIAAKQAGLNAVQGFMASLLSVASAGEYAGFTLIAAQASYLEIALGTLVTNARYLLMSTALSQRFTQDTSLANCFEQIPEQNHTVSGHKKQVIKIS